MTKRILVLIATIALGPIGAVAQVGAIDPNRPSRSQDHEQEQEKKQRYTCPMHREIVRAEPGQCPKCGMTLVPLKENGKRRTPNSEHPMPKSELTSHQEMTHNANGMAMPEHQVSMHSSVNIADPMNRESSGTSWIPDS